MLNWRFSIQECSCILQRQLKLYVARSHRNYSIPHDPDRAFELLCIYLPKAVAPSSVAFGVPQIEELKTELSVFSLRSPAKPEAWAFRLTPCLRPCDAEYDLHF